MFEFSKPVFLIRDPQLIKKLTVKDFEYFADRRQFIPPETDILFGKSLVLLQGHKWKGLCANVRDKSNWYLLIYLIYL